MKVGIHIDRSVEEIEVLITAQERNRKVDACLLYTSTVGNIDQCNGEYERRPSRSRIRP